MLEQKTHIGRGDRTDTGLAYERAIFVQLEASLTSSEGVCLCGEDAGRGAAGGPHSKRTLFPLFVFHVGLTSVFAQLKGRKAS